MIIVFTILLFLRRNAWFEILAETLPEHSSSRARVWWATWLYIGYDMLWDPNIELNEDIYVITNPLFTRGSVNLL